MMSFRLRIVYIVGLMLSVSALFADEFADKLAMQARLDREQSRLYNAVEQGHPFIFSPDLVRRFGLDRLMQHFYPRELWETGVILPQNVAMPRTIPPMNPAGPDVEFASEHQEPESPVYSLDELTTDPYFSPGEEVVGILRDIFEPEGQAATPLAIVRSPMRPQTSTGQVPLRRSLRAELNDAAAWGQELTNEEALLEQARFAAQVAAMQAQPSTQMPAAADRLIQMLVDMESHERPAGMTSPATPVIQRVRDQTEVQRGLLSDVSLTPTSGQKRSRDEFETPPPKRSRRQEESGFLTPGDLTPIDRILPGFRRTPDDDDDNGGGSRRITTGVPSRIVRNLRFE